MDRLTIRNSDGAWDVPLRNDNGVYIPSQEVIDRLAAYEETGMEPEEVEAAKKIVARLALADYPHNFQRERSDIVSYMRWITSVMEEAKAWWKNLLEAREDAEKALKKLSDNACLNIPFEEVSDNG